MLRSKTYFLTCGLALTTMFGLDAVALSQKAHSAKKPLTRQQPAKLPPQAQVILPVGKLAVQTAVAKQQVTTALLKPINTQEAPRGNIRPLPAQKLQKAYQQMAKKAQNNKKAFSAVGTKKNAFKSLKAKGLFSKTKAHFPKQKHVVKERAPNGDALTIEDGSAWTIKDSDQKIAKNWSENTSITFVPNKLSLWSKLLRRPLTHKYRIVNLKTKESAQANLSLGPFIHNPHTLRIYKILKPKGEVAFSNGMLWKCDTSKASQMLLNDWRIGDFVITGTNNTWFGLGQQEIIINVSSDNWLPAQRFL